MDLNAWTDAQRSVIGSLLIDPEHCAGEIFHRARREHFGDPSLLHIFEAALSLWNDNKPIDAVTVLFAAGEPYRELIERCMRETPTVVNLPAYLDILRSSARLSALQRAASEILSAQTSQEAAEIFERVGQHLRENEDVEDLSWEQCVSDYLDRMSDRTPINYLTWGIKELDSVLNVSPGKFVILAADSSTGKTALALQFAYHIASTGKRVGFFSLETDKESLTDRLMAEKQVAGIELPRSKARALSTHDYQAATEAGDRSTSLPLRLIRNADTVEAIRSKTIQRRFDVIFVDYLQLIAAEGERRWDIVTKVSIQLHRMAQQLGVVVVGLSQITPPEKVSKRAPTMDDLRESRQLKHDADVIMIMTLDEAFRGARCLTIDKNKDGKRGQKMLLEFDAPHMTFTRASRSRLKEVFGQVVLKDLPDDEGGDLPF